MLLREVKQIGQLIKTDSFGGNPQCGRVYSPNGLCPTINTCGGGQREPKVLVNEEDSGAWKRTEE